MAHYYTSLEVRRAVQGENNVPNAFLASFSNGKLLADSEDKIEFACFQSSDKDIKSRNKRILVAETARMNYVGHNTGPLAPKASTLSKYMLVVHDKRTGKARVVDAELYNLQPELKDKPADDEESDEAEMTFVEKSDMLTGAFGSSRKRRAMVSRQKNKIKGDTLDTAVGTAVDQAFSLPDADRTLTPQKKAQAASEIPPHNIDAQTPAEVYKLTDIITSPELECMVGPAAPFIDSDREVLKEWREKAEYPDFILHHLSILPIEERARSLKACCLMYLDFMIKMFKLTFKDFRRKDPLPSEWPAIVKRSLMTRFCLSSTLPSGKVMHAMPVRMKDTLLSYMLVLCLILDQFNLDFTRLQKDIKVSQSRLTLHLRALGCKVRAQKLKQDDKTTVTLNTAELVVPLTFPVQQREKSKKERR